MDRLALIINDSMQQWNADLYLRIVQWSTAILVS